MPEAVIAHAARGERRLGRKFGRITVMHRKRSQVAVTALVGRIDPALLAEFEVAARWPLTVRWRYSFIRTYKPVLDDAEYRSFDTMEQYRQWCERGSPDWLGYGRVRVPAG